MSRHCSQIRLNRVLRSEARSCGRSVCWSCGYSTTGYDRALISGAGVHRRLARGIPGIGEAATAVRPDPACARARRPGIAEGRCRATHASLRGDIQHRSARRVPVPRLIESAEWAALSIALAQRVRALSAFVVDAYGARAIVSRRGVPGRRAAPRVSGGQRSVDARRRSPPRTAPRTTPTRATRAPSARSCRGSAASTAPPRCAKPRRSSSTRSSA